MAGDADAPQFTVAFQGEKGAYSEQAIFELLGRNNVQAVGFDTFDRAFAAVSTSNVDLLMVPIENSLGGTIHANCDLQLQHNLFIIAEHDFRVRHSLMALPGTKKENLKKIISHTQALAQCDSYISRLGVMKEAVYDTAGSAKMVSEGKLEGVGAICSEIAAENYNLEVLETGIEDDSNNFTRFLLLRKDPVQIPHGVDCKTSIVFALDNQAGALFKALSVFSLREIDLTKIESRPCKPDSVDKMERQYMTILGLGRSSKVSVFSPQPPPAKKSKTAPHYRYVFYLDFVARVDETNASNAMSHLQEMSTFVRVLGTYPRGGSLVGLDNLGPRLVPIQSGSSRKKRLGIMGFGTFGQFLAKKMAPDFDVFGTSRSDYSELARNLGVGWCSSLEVLLEQRLDILIISTSILSFENEVRKLSRALRERASENNLLVVDVLSVKVHAKTTMLALLPENVDILCTHPMFGPESGKHGWRGLPFVYERVRLLNAKGCEEFVRWWDDQGCRMVDMTCELHDECAAGSQFITHLTGRTLDRLGLRSTPIDTKGFESLLTLVRNVGKDSFDLFLALYKYNPNAASQMQALEDALKEVAQQLRKSMENGS